MWRNVFISLVTSSQRALTVYETSGKTEKNVMEMTGKRPNSDTTNAYLKQMVQPTISKRMNESDKHNFQ